MYIYIYALYYIYIYYTYITLYWGGVSEKKRGRRTLQPAKTAECRTMSPRNALHPGQAPWQVVENNATASAWTPAASRLGSTHFWDPIIVAVPMHLEIFGAWFSVKANFGTLLHKSIEYQCQRRWHMLRLLTGPFVPWLNHQTSHLRSISRRSEALHHDLNGIWNDMDMEYEYLM